MARKHVIDDTKYMTMVQCLRIRENQYRNADCTEDYCPFAIEQRIAELGTKQAERMVDHRHVGEFDEQLFALLPEGQQLLNLIDKAFIDFKNKTCVFLYNDVLVHKTNKGVSMKTIGELKHFIKQNARLSFADYGDRDSYRGDYNLIRQAQRECKKSFWFYRDDQTLVDGEYFGGRLIIKGDKITYIAGQYAPTEVWWALSDYLNKHGRA